jgi:hypothetical protein
MLLDKHLYNGGIRLSILKEFWSVRTLRRDLKMFERLGYPSESFTVKPGVEYIRRYPLGQKPMFTASVEE